MLVGSGGRIIAWLVLGNTGAVPWPEAEAVWKLNKIKGQPPGRLEIWSAGRLFLHIFSFGVDRGVGVLMTRLGI